MIPLPSFKYFNDPLNHRVIKESKITCLVCDKNNGYIVDCSVYPDPNDEYSGNICPWCIADGMAHLKLSITFNLISNIEAVPILPESTEVLITKTPGFPTWNYKHWLCHCSDCMVFMGDASREDINQREFLEKIFDIPKGIRDVWPRIVENYKPGGSPTFLKFKCLHCNEFRYYADWS